METTSDDELLMSPGMDATIFLVQIGIDYIAYSTLQLFELLNTKFLLKMMNQKEEGEGRLDSTGEGEGEAGEDETTMLRTAH